MIKKHPIIIFILLIYTSICANSLQKRIIKLIKNSPYSQQSIGVIVKCIESDSVLVSINHNKHFNPASVMKLITGAAAFELLGDRYRYKTEVYIDTSSFNRKSGVLDGSLYIRGGGDPGFLAERLWLFVQHLTHYRIKKICKDLILDDSFFDRKINGPGFDNHNSSRAYEAPIAALSANFNTVAIHISPGTRIGDPVFITTFPRLKGVKIISTAKTTAPDDRSNLNVRTELMDGKTAILVYGNMNLNEKPQYKYRKVWSTWENFGWVLQGLFEQNGIEFKGSVKHGVIPSSLTSRKPFYTFHSRPLPEYIYNMFKYSSNFAAEMVFKTIASEHDTLPGSWENGARIVDRWWQKQKISTTISNISITSRPVIINGSGMGDGNKVSPAQIAALLEYVWQKKSYTPEFINALSVAGVDGTLDQRFKKSPLKGIIRGKTGTLNDRGVSNLAGYILLPKKTYIFAIFITNKKMSQFSHWVLQQKILETVTSPAPEKKKTKK
jgi:D-alanyl-D-alanine carboxypeptidase/D-alanyl-D-alanine-endopeptidase (penicillin-binding protein 4)